MFSQKIKYFLYGSLASASLITVIAQATSSDGVFGDYFQNMITDAVGCGTNTAITGFKTSPYGTQECTTFQEIVRSVLGGSIAGPGKAVVGFDGTTGAPVFGDVNWHRSGADISYTGGNVGIGTATPGNKLQINHDNWSIVTRRADGSANSERKATRGSLDVNDIYIRSVGKWISDIAGGSECSGNAYVGSIPDACMNDGGPSMPGDALEAYCDHGYVRLCLSGEYCPWRSGIYTHSAPGSRFGSYGNSAYTWCGNPTIRNWNYTLTGHW